MGRPEGRANRAAVRAERSRAESGLSARVGQCECSVPKCESGYVYPSSTWYGFRVGFAFTPPWEVVHPTRPDPPH
jgi:hypothetical protein